MQWELPDVLARSRPSGCATRGRLASPPPAAFVRDVRAALQHELKKCGDTASPPEAGIDSGMTRATRVTLRGVLKRIEDAFGTGRKGSGGG